MSAARFSDLERHLLLSQPLIGPRVVARLEEVGVCSIRELCNLGADRVVSTICSSIGSRAWANRRNALESLIERLGTGQEGQIA